MRSEALENSDTCSEDYYERKATETGDSFFRDCVGTVWRKKSTFILWTMIITAIVVAGGAFVYFSKEEKETAVLQFKLEFSGVEKGEYPNGSKFSPMDIISFPVLEQVYSQNGLEKYMQLKEFQNSVKIFQTNKKFEAFEKKYAEMLSNNNLGATQRERIEVDYLENKKGVMVPVYSLSLSQEGLVRIPAKQVPKVLKNILQVWTDYAIHVKGVTRYEIPLVSINMLDMKELRSKDYLVAVDMLRKMIGRIVNNINQLSAIPGVEDIAVGKEKVRLNDVRIGLKDAERFQLGYLTAIIRENGLSRNPVESELYIKNKLFELDLEKKKALSKKRIYDDSMKEYGAALLGERAGGSLAFQTGGQSTSGGMGSLSAFGSSFLDSLIQLGQERSDIEFRQKITRNAIGEGIRKVQLETRSEFYQDLLAKINQRKMSPKQNVEMGKRGQEVFQTVCEKVRDSIDQLHAIYLKVSEKNLSPNKGFFTITEPVVVRKLRAFSTVRLLGLMFLVWCAGESVVFFALLDGNRSGQRHAAVA